MTTKTIENNEAKNHGGRKFLYASIIIVLLAISFGSGMYSVGKNKYIDDLAKKETKYVGALLDKYTPAQKTLSSDVDFALFWQTWDELKEKYIGSDQINDKQLFYGALKGMVASVQDPYTVFMEPVVAEEFSDDLAGTFEGIGAEIGIKDDILTIIAPLPDMPAEKAGIKSGDKVFAINGTSTSGITIDDAVSKIRGKKDTEVTLSIAREGEKNLLEIKVKRGQIIVKSVKTEMLTGDILLIKVSSFNNDTDVLFSNAVREALDKNAKGIILDLRNDPGGYLESAIEMASEWVENGKIVIEQFADKNKKNEHLSRGRARLKDVPTVVLINKGSASASEIVSGALQDHKKALILGEKSFGKGSVQTVVNFDDGSSLKVTIAKWLTPNGRSINEEGIEPDLVVPFTIEDFKADLDPQKDAAIELIKNGMKKDLIKVKNAETASTTNELDQ